MPKLPPELTDEIIAHLHDDVSALLSCCLVHTSWIHCSRNQIFGSVAFRMLSDLEEWAGFFPTASQSPAKHVQSLTVAGLWTPIGTEEFDLDGLDPTMLAHFQSFDRVRNLALTALSLPSALSSHAHFAHLRGTLKSLELYSPRAPTQDHLLRFVSSFPHLEDLVITVTNRWLYDREKSQCASLETSPPFRGNLQVLDFTQEEGEFIAGLVDLPNGVSFRSIELDCPKYRDYQPVERLLAACESTLEDLQLGSSFAG